MKQRTNRSILKIGEADFYTELHGVTRSYTELHGATRSYTELHGV